MRYLGEGRPLSRSDAWRQMAMILGHWRLRGYGLWAVEERATGTLVGRIGFFEPEGWPDFELGWMLGRHAWGKGYATEGARRALAYAFTELGRDHLISLIRPATTRRSAWPNGWARPCAARPSCSATRPWCTASTRARWSAA